MTMRRAFRALVTAGALTLAVAACGGGDSGDDGGVDEESTGEPTADESTTTTVETTATTLSREEQVIADYNAATEAVQAAFDPPDPEHPDLLATHSGPQLERYQTRLTGYQVENQSDVLLSKETNPQVISLDDTTAVVEDCLTEVLQYTDAVTRAPRGEPRTHTLLIHDDLELIEGTWKVVDGGSVGETC